MKTIPNWESQITIARTSENKSRTNSQSNDRATKLHKQQFRACARCDFIKYNATVISMATITITPPINIIKMRIGVTKASFLLDNILLSQVTPI